MFRLFFRILYIFAVFFAFIACTDVADSSQKANVADKKQKQAKLDSLNRILVLKEKEEIEKYIEKSDKSFVETGTGLCYCIVNQGDGGPVLNGNIVALDYEVRLLNNELLYSSTESGRKVFVVGHGGVESGLEEAILYLHKGDEAEIIIPSRLAHGLTGDGNKIPINSTIVYKVKVIENQLNN